MEQEQVHQRRKRYSGTHPKNYKEKYKEHQPEKYEGTIQKVISKGMTPAGMHISICVEEILAFLQIQPGQIGLDATLGYGGHTSKMLECLNGIGHLYALDIDPIEIEKTTKRLADKGYDNNILTILAENFGNISTVSQKYGTFDFMLADLGVSSMQIDNPERGFSFKQDAPLDLRLNPNEGITAAQRLQDISFAALEGMLIENADEPYATEIARAILQRNKKGNPIKSTTDLKETIEQALSFLPTDNKSLLLKKSFQRTFQALRIDINNEYEVLESFLTALPDVLSPNGRIAILTFHSGEDRLVKKFFKQFYQDGIFSEISKEVIRPSAQECNANSRANSTKMRWAIRA